MIEAGKILQNRYRIEKQIGQGGMGTVFVAVDERFGSTVAIKETFFEEEKLAKAFEREARLLNSLKHPALPKVSDYFTEENGQFIVMEFIPGEDLSEILEKSDQPFAVEEVLNWANQLCDALKYLHTQDMPVIHRDIKPQNLKLTPLGQIILLDFGLAKGNPTDVSHKTQAKSIFGYSRNYASLEQIQGTGTDPQSDLYSLSATLYHLMTGIPPADALTRAMNVLNAKSDPLIPANLINKSIPKGVAQVLQQAMALNANERPTSAVEMRLMLENCDKTVDESSIEADSRISPELLTQKTQLMSRATKVNEAAESELQTEIFTDNRHLENSTVTQIAPFYVPGQRNPRRGLLIGGAVFSSLLIIGGIGYSISESPQSNVQSTVESKTEVAEKAPVNSVPTLVNSQTAIENSNVEQTNPVNEDLVAENSPSKDEIKNTIERSKKQETTAKNIEAPQASAKPTSVTVSNLDDPEALVINTDEGKVKIIGEKIETDDFILDPDGFKIKNPGKFTRLGKFPMIPEHFKKMTPQQRQKFVEMIEKQKNIEKQKRLQIIQNKPIIPTPPVVVTPENEN